MNFTAEDFPEGLRCAECHVEFIEGQPIAQRLDGMDVWREGELGPEGEAVPFVTLICVGCSVGVPA